MPMPMPLPRATKANVRALRLLPRQCSPIAARLTSFSMAMSMPSRGRSAARTSRLSSPAILGAIPMPPDAGSMMQGVGHAPDLSDDGAAAIARRRFNALGDDHALQIGKGDVQFGAAEVDAQHEGRVWPQRIGYGATPHGALDLPVLIHPAVAFKVAHHLRDGLLGQAGAAGDFGAGHRSIPQQALDHEADGLLSRNGRGGEILHEASPIGQDDELISRAEWRQVAFKVAVVLFLSRILRNTG